VEWAVDGDDVTLGQHLLKILYTSAADFLLHLRLERLVVEVQQFLAVEWLETAEHTLTDTANSDGTNNLAFEIILVLGHGGNVPVALLDLFVGGDEVANEGEDSHDDVLSNGDNVAASDLGDGNAAIGGVGSVQVDMVRADTSGDSDLQLLGFRETLGSQVAWMEAVGGGLEWAYSESCLGRLRSSDDDLGVNQLLVKF